MQPEPGADRSDADGRAGHRDLDGTLTFRLEAHDLQQKVR
jgi:hypothetical protein